MCKCVTRSEHSLLGWFSSLSRGSQGLHSGPRSRAFPHLATAQSSSVLRFLISLEPSGWSPRLPFLRLSLQSLKSLSGEHVWNFTISPKVPRQDEGSLKLVGLLSWCDSCPLLLGSPPRVLIHLSQGINGCELFLTRERGSERAGNLTKVRQPGSNLNHTPKLVFLDAPRAVPERPLAGLE